MMLTTGTIFSIEASTALILLAALIASSNSIFTHAVYHHPHDVVHVVRFSSNDIMKAASSHTNDGLKIYPFVTNRPNGSMAHLDTTLRSRVSPAFSKGERPILPPDYFLKEYTDDHVDPEVFMEVNDENEIERVSISFPASNCLWMPSFTTKIMTVRAASEIPEKYYVTKAEQAESNRNPDNDGGKGGATELGKLNRENDKISHDLRQYEMILDETLVYVGDIEMKVAQLKFKRPKPIADLFDDIVVFIHVHPRVVSSFVYELDGIPDYLIEKNSPSYDLFPTNSTMSVKFLFKYDAKNDVVGIWVSRRPPVPNFSLLIGIDGEVVLSENVAHPSPFPEGFPAAILRANSKRKSVIRFVVHFYERPREKNVCFLIPSYQKTIVEKLVAESNQEDGTGNPRRTIPYLDYSIPHLRGFALRFTNDTYHDALTVSIVQPYPISDLMLSMYVLFDKFMAPKGLLFPNTASLRDHHTAGEEERNGVGYAKPILIFRKEERYVTFIPPDQKTQFGWYNAVPTTGLGLARKTDAPYVTVAGINHVQLAICVALNKKDSFDKTPFDEMAQWIRDYGGDVSKITTVLNKKGNDGVHDDKPLYGRHTTGGIGLISNRAIGQGDTIADIPYKVLFTASAAESNEWVKEVMKNTTKYVKKSDELHFDVMKNQHMMLMTFFMLMQFSTATDSVDWHLYFDTIPIGGAKNEKKQDLSPSHYPNLPFFYTQDELKMFSSFCPSIQNGVSFLQELAKVEYETICDAVNWFKSRISEQQYLIARAQVENRVFNLSGTLTMIPVMDHLIHDDQENIIMNFNDDEQMFKITAKYPISANSHVTMDYGINTRHKYDFFVQFGFIPSRAPDVAVLRYYKSSASLFVFRQDRASRQGGDFQVFERDEYIVVYLTKSDDSIRLFLDVIRTELITSRNIEGKSADPISQYEINEIALKFLKQELDSMPPKSEGTKLPSNAKLFTGKEQVQQTERRKSLEGLAQQLYDSHESVLEHHIKSLSSDILQYTQ
eukprot:Tbor_TRINITY_DN5659_c0_g1::TRINITY_DN5659_c0_g1_i3::g.9133::m.9133